MPIHDWTRVDAGTFHDFHQGWTIEIRRTLNRGILPSEYHALVDPRAPQVAHAETERAAYARKANRIAIRHKLGRVVAMIEIVSPGNKDSAHALRSFTHKAVEFLGNAISLVIIDLFPPTPRDPDGIHQALWDELVGARFEPRPADKPLTVASYDPGAGLDAYVEPLAVGDRLPDTPLFLGPGWYVNIPLEATYAASWAVTPQPIRDLVETTDQARA
jgi:hypothetical protein